MNSQPMAARGLPSHAARRRGLCAVLAALVGAALLGWTVRQLGLTLPASAVAALLLIALILPPGLLATRLLPTSGLLPGERLALVAVVGYPLGAASYYAFCRIGRPGQMLPLLLLAAAAAAIVHARARGHPEAVAASPSSRPHWSLFVLVPLVLLVITRGNRAFVPTTAGLAYDHSIDHSLHLAFYWEMLRGVPPRQLPTAAGVTFPSYHVLSFMPGLFLLRHGGLHVSTVYHAVSPLLRLSLLMAAVYLAVRLRTGDGRLATAALAALLLVAPAIDNALDERFVAGPPPHYFFVRSESGGGGIVVWAAVLCLLALYRQTQADDRLAPRARAVLVLASVLAGLSYSFKAQLFVLFGGAYALALVLLFFRDRSRRLLEALAAFLATTALCFWASRRPGSLGRLYFTPGLFAALYVYPNLRHDPMPFVKGTLAPLLESLPRGLGPFSATVLAVWRLVRFSPFVPAFLVHSLRRFRALGLPDLVCALAFVLALPMAYGFSVRAIDRAISPFEFLQAAQGLAFLAAVVDVAVLARLCTRGGRDGGRWVLRAALLASAGLLPLLLLSKPYVPPREAIVLGPDEQCALLFLRLHTPPEAVVVSDRTESLPELAGMTRRLNHQAVVAGFAGRRAVLEYYGREVDPWTNRRAAIRRLFTTTDAAGAEEILRRYDVDYVLELAGLPLQFPLSHLRLVYERGKARVYRVQRDVGPEPPEPPAGYPGTGALVGGLDLECRP